MNPDIFQKEFCYLSESKQALIYGLKNQAEVLFELMENVQSREMRIARENLEQSIMWAVKAVQKSQI